MGLESTTTIAGLVAANPLDSDYIADGDDHIRLLKAVLKAQFPGAAGNGFATPITVDEAQLNSVAAYVDTVDDLRLQAKTGQPIVITKGYYNVGDGGACVYRYDSTDTTTADNGMTYIVGVDGGRWRPLQPSGYPLSLRQLGFKAGDTVATDCYAQFVTLNEININVVIPGGSWYLSEDYTATKCQWSIRPNAKFVGPGRIDLSKDPWNDSGMTANIDRFPGRVFVGEAASHVSGDKWGDGDQESWINDVNMGWVARLADFLVVSSYGGAAITGMTRTSDNYKQEMEGNPNWDGGTMGVQGIVFADSEIGIIWAGFFSANRMPENHRAAYAIEIDAVNNSLTDDENPTPYDKDGWGCIGIWISAHGINKDPNSNPAACAIMIGTKPAAGTIEDPFPPGFNKGIIFSYKGFTEDANGNSTVIEMAEKQRLVWRSLATDSIAATITSSSTTADANTALEFQDNTIALKCYNGKRLAEFVNGPGTGVQANSWFRFTNDDTVTSTHVYQDAVTSQSNCHMHFNTTGNGRYYFGDINPSNSTMYMELGQTTAGDDTAVAIDFHCGATAVDYDVRLRVDTGTGTAGEGTLHCYGNFRVETNFESIRTVTAAGQTGNKTIDKPNGSVNFAAGSSTPIVVTNSLVDQYSNIIPSIMSNDATLKTVQIVATAGSFTIYPGAAATAETKVAFFVIN